MNMCIIIYVFFCLPFCRHEVEVPHTLPQTVTVDVAEEDLWSLENVGQFLQCVAELHNEDSEP